MNWIYRAGDAPALRQQATAIILQGQDSLRLAALLHPLFQRGPSAAEVLNQLATQNVTSLPDFALVEFGYQTRIILRGEIQVLLTFENGSSQHLDLSTTELLGWQEYHFTAVQQLRILAHEAGGDFLTFDSQQLIQAAEIVFQSAPAEFIASSTLPPPEEAVEHFPDSLAEPDAQATPSPALITPPELPATENLDPQRLESFDHLFGATIHGSVESAAVRAALGEEDATPDVQTPEEISSTNTFNGSSVYVSARLCPKQHVNQPERATCRSCGEALVGSIVQAVRPTLGYLRFNDGRQVELDRDIVIGRSPNMTRSSALELPKLVTVQSPNQDISRNHLRIRLENWQIFLEDLNSTNGTLVAETNGVVQRIRPADPYPAQIGSRVDFGDGVSFTIQGGNAE